MNAAPPTYAVVATASGGAVVGPGVRLRGDLAATLEAVARLEHRVGPRWVLWSAGHDLRSLLDNNFRPSRCWDLSEAYRLLVGGWAAGYGEIWAHAQSLDPAGLPDPPQDDLFSPNGSDGVAGSTDTNGYLVADAAQGRWARDPTTRVEWAELALNVQQRQQEQLSARGPRAVRTAWSESLAAVLCLELERDGLPVDRAQLEALIVQAAGPRTESGHDAAQARAERDWAVLRLAAGHEHTDLRNPTQVRELLASKGIHVPDTRAWRIEPYRTTHPLVGALLQWRKDERIATTYGWSWLDRCVGSDNRLRGTWTACDGAAGRMTAGNGLHNLPTPLRPGIAAAPGHVLVRADLGQIEPRVLAAVSGDAALAAATRADDLYAPVAAELGVARPVAKIAVLAAMYGQRSGAAGQALAGLERTYPRAMALLDQAYEQGANGEPVLTYGGRLVPTAFGADAAQAPAFEPATDTGTPAAGSGLRGARGRFARNAVIQGSAAELFKAWAATVRAMLASGNETGQPGGAGTAATTCPPVGQIVLCLHDELLVHARKTDADQVCDILHAALEASSRRWVGSDAVRFVADVRVVHRWSEAKD